MRRSMFALLAAVGMMSAAPAMGKVSISKNGNQTVYDIEIEGVDMTPVSIGGKEFVSAKFKGVERFHAVKYELGKPEIPVVRLMVDGDVVVQAVGSNLSGVSDPTKALKPAQPSWSKSLKFPPPVAYDAPTYETDIMNVEPLYGVEKVASYRGLPRQMVTLNAMRYNPVSGFYQYHNHYRVTVTSSFKEAQTQPTLALVVGAQFASSPSVDNLVRSKESQGFRVRKIIVGQNGVTTDEHIRAALKSIYNENVNLRFALIVGDAEDVPGHDSTHISGVTDHFYRAIDTDNYESDINGPDIGVGRLSVNSEAQLSTVVTKIVRYTDGRFAADRWMQHPAFITTHDRWQTAEGTHNAVIAKHFAPRGYDRVFPDASEKGGDKLYPISLNATDQQIVDHMKQGRFIINFSGHGSHTGWEDVTTQDVLSMNDPNALPWVISNACITGDFREEPVFAETWQRHPNGAITFWGSMDSSYWDEDDILEKAMYDAVFDRGTRSFDLIHQYALGEVWRHYGGQAKSAYYWETYVTFGDPSLEVRTRKSTDATVEGPDALIIGAEDASWRVTTEDAPVVGARVTLHRASDGKTVTGVTGQQGEVTLPLSAFGATAEPVTLIVAGGDLRRVSKELALIAPNQPHLGFSGWTLNGRTGGGVHVGEQINLGGVVENFGMVATSGGRLIIESVVGPGAVTRSEVTVPPMGSRERISLAAGLAFTVNAEARRGEVVRLQLRWETNEGQTGTVVLSWPVLRADIEVTAVDYGAEGVEGVGAEGYLYLTIKNIGTETIRSLELTPQSGTCTAGADGKLTIAELAPGATARVPQSIHVTTDGQCSSGSAGSISLAGHYQSVSRQLSLAAGVNYLVGVLETDVERMEGLGLAIPDRGEALSQSIQVNGSGPIKDISVFVKINHTYIGDLEVHLVSPTGKSVLLHNHTGSGNDNIEQRYGRGGVNIGELDTLIGDEARGEWKLQVRDTMASDTGTLEAVELSIRHW